MDGWSMPPRTGAARSEPGRRRHLSCRSGWAALTLLLLLVVVSACTDDDTSAPAATAPTPPVEEPAGPVVGRGVELVLPPLSVLDRGVADGLSTRLRSLADDLPDGVDGLAVRVPETPPFVSDLLELVAARGAGLACALGPDVAAIADRTAVRHGATTVCALPVPLPEPDDQGAVEPTPAVRVDVPVTELGILVGTAASVGARSAASSAATSDAADDDGEADADEPSAGPPVMAGRMPRVGLVLLGDELPATRFREGVLTGLNGVEVVEVDDADATPLEALEAVLAAGAQVVIVDGGPGAAEVVAALEGRAGIVAPVDVLGDERPPEVLLGYRIRWEQVVRVLLDSFAGPGKLEAPVLLGLDDEVIELAPGSGRSEVTAALERVWAELAARDDPRAPLVDEGPPGAVPGPDLG